VQRIKVNEVAAMLRVGEFRDGFERRDANLLSASKATQSGDDGKSS
jgi:hypothetical protein